MVGLDVLATHLSLAEMSNNGILWLGKFSLNWNCGPCCNYHLSLPLDYRLIGAQSKQSGCPCFHKAWSFVVG